jgi:holo-[acyl-carrier protein] synthase
MQFLQGIDLVKVERVKKIYEEYGEKFLEKVFSNNEINQIKKIENFQYKKIASKFSAKEAAAKALGTGISNGVKFQDFEIISTKNGRPEIKIFGVAQDKLKNLISSNVSISDDGEYVVAIVTFILAK